LTASLQLWRGFRCPSVSQWAKHRSDLWALDPRALRWALPPCGVFGHRDGRVPASDALCRSLLRESQARFHRRLVKRTTTSPDQSAFRRSRAPSTCFRMAVKDAAPASAICTIHEHDRDRSSPGSCGQAEVALTGALFRVASPLAGPGQPSFLGSGVHHGFRRLNTPRTRLLAPRLVTPTRVARTPSVASSWPAGWRGRPRRVCDTHTGYELTRRACLRETRRRETRLRGASWQGRLLRSSAKRSALGCAQGAFRREPLPRETKPCSVNRARTR